MIPKTVLCDETGDIDLSQGLRFTSTLAEYVVERLDENMSFFLGESFLDARKGIPYWERVIGQKPDTGLLESIYRAAALLIPGTSDVPAFVAEFDRQTRKVKPRFTVRLADGSTITDADLRRGFFLNIGS